MEEKKNLAEEYLAKVREEKAIYFKGYPNMPFYQEINIKMAFYAGRESVTESLPKLKWRRVHKDGPYLAVTVFNWFYRIEYVYNEFHLFCNGYFISCYISPSDAKQSANEHYKKQIKQALGL